MSFVSLSALRELSNLIPKHAYKPISIQMGYSSSHVISQMLDLKIRLTTFKFECLKEAFFIWGKANDKTYIGGYTAPDIWQTQHYYVELNNLINSDEFILYTQPQKNKVWSEQKRISKLINK